jgi:hypothetical protein
VAENLVSISNSSFNSQDAPYIPPDLMQTILGGFHDKTGRSIGKKAKPEKFNPEHILKDIDSDE